MQQRTVKFITASIMFTAISIAGCASMGGAGGGSNITSNLNQKYKPPGVALASSGDEELLLSSAEASGPGLPYQAQPSNPEHIAPDAGKLYGIY
jgi:hypothetical protein